MKATATAAALETADEVINALGGTSAVAAKFGVDPSAISHWRKDGIPAARRFDVVEALKKIRKRAEASAFRAR